MATARAKKRSTGSGKPRNKLNSWDGFVLQAKYSRSVCVYVCIDINGIYIRLIYIYIFICTYIRIYIYEHGMLVGKQTTHKQTHTHNAMYLWMI